jgi:hypothetical protein
MVRIENEYRINNCEGFALSYCTVPYTECPCDCDIWNCEEIRIHTLEVIDYYSNDGDLWINGADNEITDEHYLIYVN